MNIVTQALAKHIKDKGLKDWIAGWDALEALVIHVHKEKGASPEDEAEYSRLRPRLQKDYARWQAALRPHWQQSMVAGKPAEEDPFTRLLSTTWAEDFAGDWRLMQTLPAAREAINRYLLDLQERNPPTGER